MRDEKVAEAITRQETVLRTLTDKVRETHEALTECLDKITSMSPTVDAVIDSDFRLATTTRKQALKFVLGLNEWDRARRCSDSALIATWVVWQLGFVGRPLFCFSGSFGLFMLFELLESQALSGCVLVVSCSSFVGASSAHARLRTAHTHTFHSVALIDSMT